MHNRLLYFGVKTCSNLNKSAINFASFMASAGRDGTVSSLDPKLLDVNKVVKRCKIEFRSWCRADRPAKG